MVHPYFKNEIVILGIVFISIQALLFVWKWIKYGIYLLRQPKPAPPPAPRPAYVPPTPKPRPTKEELLNRLKYETDHDRRLLQEAQLSHIAANEVKQYLDDRYEEGFKKIVDGSIRL